MTTAQQLIDPVQRRRPRDRHLASLTLLVHGLAVVWLAVGDVRFEWRPSGQYMVVPGVTYLALWAVLRWRERVADGGHARDRLSAAAVALRAAVIFAAGLLWMGLYFLGPGAFLGCGLIVVGVWLRDSRLWAPAIALVVLSPLVNLYLVDHNASMLGPQPGTVVLAVLAAILLGLAAVTYRGERSERPAAPVG